VIEKSLVRSLLRLPARYPRLVLVKTQGGPGRRGLPDLIGCYQGRALAWEVKVEGGVLTPLQARELERWSQAGAMAAVIRSVEDAERLLREA